ncbi:J domain-containing protein [Amycolatopsis rubida]|uniref:DnaJ domain-containing protein n=1 Tax=Amycolatopsis rubida TaxID=112413 RepID=A0A1I5XIM4_9PSEU|nr:DnaJ domain-containing protein [Amycolatopsis rubida]SFQ31804.1 DnaJ domain-containing protein [Amycolatopsis rubida]
MTSNTADPRTAPGRLTALERRVLAAQEAIEQADTEHAHWVLQHAYATLREQFPTATSAVVDTGLRRTLSAWTVSVNASADPLWTAAEAASAIATPNEIDEVVEGASWQIDTALQYYPPETLPGWSPKADEPGRYVLDLTAVPTVPDQDRQDSLPAGISRAVQETVDSWPWQVALAAREYCRGLVEARYLPLEETAEHDEVRAVLARTVAPADRAEFATLTAAHWEEGINYVHGLALGAVEVWETSEGYGPTYSLDHIVPIFQCSLARNGVSLREVSEAFGGDVRLVALAVADPSGRRAAPAEEPVRPLPKFYQRLGLPQNIVVTRSDIDAAYRARVRALRPDLVPTVCAAQRTAEKDDFAQVAEAYKVLSDPDARARYDREISPF